MLRIREFGVLFMVAVFIRCTSSPSESHDLKMAIVQSIRSPFNTTDTLVCLVPMIWACGNSSDEELERIYRPDLKQRSYIDGLRRRYPGAIIVDRDSLIKADPIRRGDDGRRLTRSWDVFLYNKIFVTVWGEIIDDDTVKIREEYSRNEWLQRFEKVCICNDGKWTCVLQDSSALMTSLRIWSED
jgi:hypothetical protein